MNADRLPQDKIDTPLLIYILYLAGVIIGITAVMGVIWAYMERKHAAEWLQSHYTFLIHTFWKGLLYTFAGALLTVLLVGYLILLAALVWWIYRCFKGLQLLRRHEAVPDPKGWLF